jgi:hypothetical protein
VLKKGKKKGGGGRLTCVLELLLQHLASALSWIEYQGLTPNPLRCQVSLFSSGYNVHRYIREDQSIELKTTYIPDVLLVAIFFEFLSVLSNLLV